MSRQDITMDAEYGEVETPDDRSGKRLYAFHLLAYVEQEDNVTFRYGEIIVPADFAFSYSAGKGIHALIPYTPDSRRLMLRLVMESGSGGREYLRNATTGKAWYPVLLEQASGTTDVTLSALFSLNEDGIYRFQLREGYLAVYSGADTDFEIGGAKRQNEVFLLKAAAGNLYQHPTTGVGLIDFLHSSLENNGLATKLQSEFEADKVIVKNAYMDSETGELLLETIEKEDNHG